MARYVLAQTREQRLTLLDGLTTSKQAPSANALEVVARGLVLAGQATQSLGRSLGHERHQQVSGNADGLEQVVDHKRQLVSLGLSSLGYGNLECVGLVLLDEGGKEMRSIEFADYMKRKMNTVNKRLVFIIGGPYGFSPKVYEAAHEKMSLSRMTFSHQMVRLIFVEQLYRAMTILNGGPYHHE